MLKFDSGCYHCNAAAHLGWRGRGNDTRESRVLDEGCAGVCVLAMPPLLAFGCVTACSMDTQSRINDEMAVVIVRRAACGVAQVMRSAVGLLLCIHS